MKRLQPEITSESTLTDRYQTTIPAMVRKALGLQKGDKLEFLLDDAGQVQLRRQEHDEHHDPTVASFLQFLETDMTNNPQSLVELDAKLFELMKAVSSRVPKDLDLDSPLSDEN